MAEREVEGSAPEDENLSHDPRTWLRLKPAAPAGDAPAEGLAPAPAAEPGASFDPSTWGKRPSAPPAEARPGKPAKAPKPAKAAKEKAADSPPVPAAASAPAAGAPGLSDSFDPSTWGKGAAAGPAEMPEAGSGPQPAAEGAPPPSSPRTGLPLPLILGGVAALAVVVGGTAWLLKSPPAPADAVAQPAETGAPAAPAVMTASAEVSALTLNGSGELLAALTANGVAAAQADAAAKAAQGVLGAGPGELRVELSLTRSGGQAALTGMKIRRPDGSGVDVAPAPGGGFAAQPVATSRRSEIVVARGQMDTESFYSSAVAAGVNDALIPEFAAAFTYDFDFQREIEPGDVFEAAWEQTVNDQGQPIGAKRLLYASLRTKQKSKAVYRFAPPGEGEPGWFDGAGRSIRRAIMRTPVEGARISSKFGYRTHPILGYTKLHKGTDFAAPIGTPIYAAGTGVIQVAAPRGAAGNFVSLVHDNGWRTTYMHLNAFSPAAVTGQRVTQGTEIGQVGTTGRSTGPHLHFEVYIDDEPVDSMTIAVEEGLALQGEAMKAFQKERDRIDALRAKSSV